MKFSFDRKLFKYCLYAFVTLAALLLFERILQASGNVWLSVMSGVSFVLGLLGPFITAILVAYILSPAITGLEKLFGKVLKKERFVKGRTMTALVIVYAATLGGIGLFVSYVIPGLIRNIGDLIANWNIYYAQAQDFYQNLLKTYPLLADSNVQAWLNTQLDTILKGLNFAQTDILATVLQVGSRIVEFLLGLVLSFYLLIEHEHIEESFTRLVRARFSEKRAASIVSFFLAVDRVFGKYISAKLLVVIIIFVLSLAVFSLLGVPYLVLMCAIVALSTLVPYIGPIVGAIPPIVLAWIESPGKAIYVLISIVAIQALNGNLIEPFIFSDRLGLSPFWVLLSVILGGGLFGFWGVLFAVPVAAVIKLIIARWVHVWQEHRKKLAGEHYPES